MKIFIYIISIYRSQLGNSMDLLQEIKHMTDPQKPTLILGDLNACYIENFGNRFIQGVLNMGFKQLVQEPTHIRGRLIDHAYILDLKQEYTIHLERYSPYYSDHDAICICITRITED